MPLFIYTEHHHNAKPQLRWCLVWHFYVRNKQRFVINGKHDNSNHLLLCGG